MVSVSEERGRRNGEFEKGGEMRRSRGERGVSDCISVLDFSAPELAVGV